MSKQRYLDTKFWSDGYVSKLDPVEKLLFVYLMTNERTNLAGIYELPPKYMAVETGIEISMLENMLSRFERDGKMVRFEGYVRMTNTIKHQNLNNANIRSGVVRIVEGLSTRVFKGLKVDEDDSYMSLGESSHLIKLNLIKSNSIETIKADEPPEEKKPEKTKKPVDEVSKSYYDTVTELQLPVRNHTNLRSRIKAMEKEVGKEPALLYLDFVRTFYPKLPDDGYKPQLTESLDIYAKRVALKSWIERQVVNQQKPATAGGRPLF